MDFAQFHGNLRILASLSMQDLVEGDVIGDHDVQAWRTFKLDPLHWLLRADGDRAEAVWHAIQRKTHGVDIGEGPERASDLNVIQFVPRNRTG
jgi:hypothetical protein